MIGELLVKIRRGIREPEVIGLPECPLLLRWTLIPFVEHLLPRDPVTGKKIGRKPGDPRFKLMVHHFLPNADDRAVHDHPRAFLTLILRGSYDDMKPCAECDGLGWWNPDERPERPLATLSSIDDSVTIRGVWTNDGVVHMEVKCRTCSGTGVVLNERMSPGTLRFRPAMHRHRTRVCSDGCWTLVLMGPLERPWGFWVNGKWMFWKDHEREFGAGMRCDESGRFENASRG